MKIPERLIGFVDYDGTKYPFEFDEENFRLNLYTPTMEMWNETSSFREFFSGFNEDRKKHEWIGELRLEGITSEQKKILFCLKDRRSNFHGFYSYTVNWYFYYSDQMSADKLDGFSIANDEINYFFTPKQALESVLHFSSDKTKLEKITVNSNKQITENCGKYRIIPHIDAHIEVTCYAVSHSDNYTNPIDATSKMVISFSSPVSIDVVVLAYMHTISFLQFITYRKNVLVDLVPIFYLNHEGKRDYAGILVFGRKPIAETNKKRKDIIIPYPVLQKQTASIFTNIKNNKLRYRHLCDSIEETHSYSLSRIIMIFATFESEFRNIYGIYSERSQDYIDTKNEIVTMIDKYTKTLHGAKRRYSKQLRKYVEKRDGSFEFSLKKALIDCENIMIPFIKSKYGGNYKDVIEQISERMGIVRNGIAHSHLDLSFDAIHVSDVKIVEELIYAMRLKHCRIKNEKIQSAINKIFSENIAI